MARVNRQAIRIIVDLLDDGKYYLLPNAVSNAWDMHRHAERECEKMGEALALAEERQVRASEALDQAIADNLEELLAIGKKKGD